MYFYKENINILIVDDTPEHIHIASSILKSLNYPIRVANNGDTALKLIEKQIPTLLLLDVSLPKMNGFEICKLLKQNPLYEDMAIIFMTVSGDEHSISKGFSLGAQDYVIKPYNSYELIARVNTHIKLVCQKKELKNSYKELDQFCHTISHDLKSPILVIRQLLSLLAEELNENLSEDAHEILKQLDNKSEDTISMIERLLELSKVSHLECTFKQLNIEKIIKQLFNELSSLEPNRKISFICSKLPTLTGDETLIKLLIQNVLTNALKFSRNNEHTIINISFQETNTCYKIFINDNGIGFDMKYSNKLFNVFERLHNKEDFEGSGIGLSIIKRIMERHDGSVSITSQLNIGTCLSLNFFKC